MSNSAMEYQTIQAVDNALDLMEALADEEQEELQLSDLALRLGMSKTKTFRLLATLENRGYVEKAAKKGRYCRGPAIYDLAPKALASMKLLRLARPAMQRLAVETNEAVYLGVERDGEMLFLDFIDTTQQVRGVSLLCRRYPLEETAAGVVIAAHARPAGYGRTRRQNHCLDRDTLAEGISSLAVPIFHAKGEVRSVLCLVGPSFRLDPRLMEQEMLPRLREAAGAISAQLGRSNHFLERTCS